ncbi:MAG TPA: mersacidin/lichenicidin family type 2 lantibiotic [Ktedonobacteraceae bacterium]
MKFDIVRAWKDEAYRQNLSQAELETLPVNPAGELDESTLAEIYGGDDPGWYGLASAASATEHHRHTLAGLCDINIFSAFLPITAFPRLINIGKYEKQVCASIN